MDPSRPGSPSVFRDLFELTISRGDVRAAGNKRSAAAAFVTLLTARLKSLEALPETPEQGRAWITELTREWHCWHYFIFPTRLRLTRGRLPSQWRNPGYFATVNQARIDLPVVLLKKIVLCVCRARHTESSQGYSGSQRALR